MRPDRPSTEARPHRERPYELGLSQRVRDSPLLLEQTESERGQRFAAKEPHLEVSASADRFR